jgi:hypothetical protein
MFKLYILLVFSILFSAGAGAQTKIINGYLLDSFTHYPVAGKVTNATSKRSVTTDANGFFKLEAGANDFIFAVAPAYKYDTVSYNMLFRDTITLFLAPSGNVLPNVIVTSKYTRYQMDSLQRRAEFEQDRGTVFNAVDKSHGPGFGLNVNLDRFFKKKYRDKKDEEKVFNRLEKNAYVNYRFSPQLVSMYTGLKGDSLQTFILRYSPSYEWMRQHPTNEDVLYYINDKLKQNK